MKKQPLLDLILKIIAMLLAFAVVILGYFNVTGDETNIAFLGVGLFALALASLGGDKHAE